jgi:hypothetical protein
MTENTLNNVGTSTEVETAGAEVKADEPKTYTQAEVDGAVQKRVAREMKKLSAYKERNAELEAELAEYRGLSALIAEGGNVKGSPKEQIRTLKETYDLSDEAVNSILSKSKNNDERDLQRNMARYNADKFIEENDADDIQEEFDRINQIPAAERSIMDKAKLKAIKEHQDSAKKTNDDTKARDAIANDIKWLQKEVGNVELKDILSSGEFKDFISETPNMYPSDAIKMFVKFNGKDKMLEMFGKGDTRPVSTGSVKDNGSSKLKEYYSSEDVDNLSAKDLDDPVIRERVRQSMTKWK